MKILVTLLLLIGTSIALAEDKPQINGNNNNVNICQPKIEVKTCGSCCKTKTVTKVVEKIVEKPVDRVVEVEVKVEERVIVPNRLSLLLGVGPKGNLRETVDGPVTRYETENGPVLGLQYSRDLSESLHPTVLSIQGQTNRTFMIGIGKGF